MLVVLWAIQPPASGAEDMQMMKSGGMKQDCGKNCKSNQATADDVASNGLDCKSGTVCQKENGKCSVGKGEQEEKGNCRTLMEGDSGKCNCFCAVEKKES